MTAYERWELTDFDAPPPPPPSPEPDVPAVRLPTAEEVEAMHKQAHDEGFAAGFEEGRQTGFDGGYSEGHTEGMRVGQEQGYQTGFQQGYQEGQAGAVAQAARLAEVAESFSRSMDVVEQPLAESVLQLALSLARQLTKVALKVDPEAILPVVREAMQPLSHAHGRPQLFLHPEDRPLVQQHIGELLHQTGWQVLDDPTLTPGGCRVQAGSTEVDATIETRWERLIEAIGRSS